MNKQKKPFLPLIILFIVLNAFLLTSKNFLAKWNIDSDIVLIANSVLFILSLLTFLMQKKALNNTNPNVFIRAMMGSVMLKMLVVVVIIFIYVFANRQTYNRNGIFAAMALYFLYLIVEVRIISKLNKKNG